MNHVDIFAHGCRVVDREFVAILSFKTNFMPDVAVYIVFGYLFKRIVCWYSSFSIFLVRSTPDDLGFSLACPNTRNGEL